ncbi:cytochrome-c oxidase, cbb3-type subunit III [Limobrevibacterium gyesilva]|uniref:Cbb3-type cytochrome c oxidase subunit n=1 Tax=Limobrevibacterium gyesilva TaxID=2991712 RepID=A0AA41YMU6_9PROT|nr:cytochrome-c oxidase, cbb3-type subunit III [Limobrevibacterium gyesilva]MCW3473185.1 cytochrome-c oxidase, cbb3-type subunit III [Limobrevibacterium gyesilva]
MAIEERDPHTGHATTGHEWNGIKELNTPVPRPVYFFLATTFLFSLFYWVLMPAWPTGVSYTKGLLGIDQRTTVAENLRQAAMERAVWATKIEASDYSVIPADASLMQVVRQTGRTLFGDNCAACHGANAKGGPGFPNLTAGSWLWGGSPEAVAETIRVGVNSTHGDARVAQMPAFGKDQMLPRSDIENVAAFVQSLSNPSIATGPDAGKVAAGRQVFATNCTACHGEAGKGNIEMGAPDLTDTVWIYGGDRQSIMTTLYGGRQGHMPTWEARLSPLDRKILTLYILDLRRRAP